MKYPECEDCYFYGVEPAICDDCLDADQFEPAEPDDDAFDKLLKLSEPVPRKVVPIRYYAKPKKEEDQPELKILQLA